MCASLRKSWVLPPPFSNESLNTDGAVDGVFLPPEKVQFCLNLPRQFNSEHLNNVIYLEAYIYIYIYIYEYITCMHSETDDI